LICTPITGKTKPEILDQLETIIPQSPDLIEWRADFFSELFNHDLTIELVQEIKEKTNLPLIFTIRAEHEGGEKISLSEEEKVTLICKVCEKTNVDIVDYETSNDEKYVKQIRQVSKHSRVSLILSYHNFYITPDDTEIIERAKLAESCDADIAKFAVMPNSKEDVLRLLNVTKEINRMLDIPVVSMSMGDIGSLSRIIGWAYGSIITFGIGVELSAPGQIPVEQLRKVIRLTQKIVPNWQ
jgi:3-dehydroquinate dehydratase I